MKTIFPLFLTSGCCLIFLITKDFQNSEEATKRILLDNAQNAMYTKKKKQKQNC